MCSGLRGTVPRPDRDFGCVERTGAAAPGSGKGEGEGEGTSRRGGSRIAGAAAAAATTDEVDNAGEGGEGGSDGAAPTPYFSTGAAFTSTADEVVVGLGQHSAVSKAPCK